ncbi:MAG: ABC transporter permease [Candidatus Humimicrobiaceae bacterium]
MTAVANLVSRNIKLFFRDKTSVFFSLLAVFIIIGLYVLFLGNMMSGNLQDLFGNNARFAVDSWIMAGLLAVISMTTTMGAFGTMVEDTSNKIIKDFSSSPIKRSQLAGGYVLSSFIIGLIISIVALILAEAYIFVGGGKLLSLISLIKLLGVMLLSVFSSSAMVFFIVSFFKSNNAFSTASTIIGTLIGFLTGIYIPIGSLPEAVQVAIKIFPLSHAGALFRQIMMEVPISAAFADLPVQAADSFKEQMGVIFYAGSIRMSPLSSILVLISSGILFYALSVLKFSIKKKS